MRILGGNSWHWHIVVVAEKWRSCPSQYLTFWSHSHSCNLMMRCAFSLLATMSCSLRTFGECILCFWGEYTLIAWTCYPLKTIHLQINFVLVIEWLMKLLVWQLVQFQAHVSWFAVHAWELLIKTTCGRTQGKSGKPGFHQSLPWEGKTGRLSSLTSFRAWSRRGVKVCFTSSCYVCTCSGHTTNFGVHLNIEWFNPLL